MEGTSQEKRSRKRESGKENRDWGAEAEQIAADFLYAQGFVIRERGWRMGGSLEIDIIAEKDGWMVFAEVKARKGDHQDPVAAVDKRKRMKMIRGADVFLKAQRFEYQYRFDIIAITGDKNDYKLEHYPDAFLPPLNGKY